MKKLEKEFNELYQQYEEIDSKLIELVNQNKNSMIVKYVDFDKIVYISLNEWKSKQEDHYFCETLTVKEIYKKEIKKHEWEIEKIAKRVYDEDGNFYQFDIDKMKKLIDNINELYNFVKNIIK